MKNILLYSTVGPQWIRNVKKFLNNKDFIVSGYLTTQNVAKDVQNVFPNAKFYDRLLDHKMIFSSVVDDKLIRYLEPFEREIYFLIERGNKNEYFASTFMLSMLYYKNIQYIQKIFSETKPDLVLFGGVPHNAASYILYHLCKYYGIKVFIIERLKLTDIYGYFSDIEEKHSKIIETIESSEFSDNELSANLKNYLKKIRSTDEKSAEIALPYHLQSPIRIFLKDLKNKRGLMKSLNSFYKNQLIRFKQHKLKADYEKLCENKVDVNKCYIYMALHQQPEKTTSPDGGFYAQQWLIINNISSILPHGWYLYVREHPSTFVKYSDAIFRYRNKSYYKNILLSSNVKLVSTNFDQDILINNSKAVVTVTGMVGFEAVARGIPALVFGFAHYIKCDGVFNVNKTSQLNHAVGEIVKGTKVDKNAAESFLSKLQHCPNIYISERGTKDLMKYEEEVKFELFIRIILNECIR